MERKGIYQAKIIQKVVNIMWFCNKQDEGVIHEDNFKLLTVEALALVLASVCDCLFLNSSNMLPSDWMLHQWMNFWLQVRHPLQHCTLQGCVWRSHPLPWMLQPSHQANNSPKYLAQTLQPWAVCFWYLGLFNCLIYDLQIPCRGSAYFECLRA